MTWTASTTALTGFGVEGTVERMFGAGGLEVGDEVPEGSGLVVVLY